MNPKFKRTDCLHFIGVGVCVLSIYISGPLSHDVGVAVAIGTVVLLSTGSFAVDNEPDKIKLIIGSVTDGGLRQGQLIKSLFTIALLYSGGIQLLNTGSGVSSILLGGALGISAIANEIEIRDLEARQTQKNTHDEMESGILMPHTKINPRECDSSQD